MFHGRDFTNMETTNCSNPYSNSNLKQQTDISMTSLYELMAIAVKKRENLYVLRCIMQAMEGIETVKGNLEEGIKTNMIPRNF
jgi:hypothetical protein